MPVTCPHCSTRYVLPQALLGPGGARVRCPRCREPFSVSPKGEAIPPASPAEKAAVGVTSSGNGAPETVAATGTPDSEAADAGPPASHAAYAGPHRVDVKVPDEDDSTRAVDPEAPAAAPPTSSTPATAAPVPAAASDEPADSPAAVLETPIMVARAVLDELSQHSGEAIAASREAGKLFREFGPVIAEAFEFYRRQVGPGADPAPFRAALRDKWGVDLDPSHPTGRLS